MVENAGNEGETCRPFPSLETAKECINYATSSKRGDDAIPLSDVRIQAFETTHRIYAVFFPQAKLPALHPFWISAGLGASSRFAEESLKHINLLRRVTDEDPEPKAESSEAHQIIRERIAALLERAPVGPPRGTKASPDDVYLYPTGMAALYSVHKSLIDRFNESSVLFGFAFHATIHLIEDWGAGSKFLGLGTSKEIDLLEDYLQVERSEGRKIQAVFTEFPSNPLLVTPDLGRLRKLADTYGFLLVVDDTIGSFCNVDLLGAADLLVTSLTKSFSGYADVLGGSVVINPSSSRYEELKLIFQEFYRNEYFNGDAIVLEKNSRDYLARSTILNNNTLAIVEYLYKASKSPASSLFKIHYPTLNPSLSLYHERMRPATADFTPGYGGLFSIEFKHVKANSTFHDNLNIHHGPHFGFHLSMSIPYTTGLYGKDLGYAARYELRETQLRIAVGQEDLEELIETFQFALDAADRAYKELGEKE